MRQTAFRVLFVVFNVALLTALTIALLGAFTSTQFPLGTLLWVTVLLGIGLWTVDPAAQGRFLGSKYLWPAVRHPRR